MIKPEDSQLAGHQKYFFPDGIRFGDRRAAHYMAIFVEIGATDFKMTVFLIPLPPQKNTNTKHEQLRDGIHFKSRFV